MWVIEIVRYFDRQRCPDDDRSLRLDGEMLAKVFGRKMAQRAEPDLDTAHLARARRARQVFNSADDVAHQCCLMHVGYFLLPPIFSRARRRSAPLPPRRRRRLPAIAVPPFR